MNQSEAMQKIIEETLAENGVVSKDGWAGPTCQTGEKYVQLYLRCSGVATLTKAIIGAIAIFGEAGWTCYWRTKADYDFQGLDAVYVRFCMTNKPELEQAA